MGLLDAMDAVGLDHEAVVEQTLPGHLATVHPAMPIVVIPSSRALVKAAIRLAELPLVENPIKPSPCLANEINWRTKTWANPTSLPAALIIATSAVRLIAESAGRPAVIGWRNSTVK